MQHIQDLRPTAFTLNDLDDELHSMALIRSLPDEYKSLAQSLMLLDDLNKNTIREAFLAEETNSRRRAEQSIAGTSDLALVSFNNSKNDQECDFCGFKGHTSADCRKLVSARAWARKPRPAKKHAANNADTEPEPSTVVESAGNASANHLSSSPLQIDANFDWNARLRRHFSYDSSCTLDSQLQAVSHPHSLSKQSHCIFGRCRVCCVQSNN